MAKQEVIDLVLEEDLETAFANSTLGENVKAMGEILRSPYILVGNSDAGAKVQLGAENGYMGAGKARDEPGAGYSQAHLHGRLRVRTRR